MVNVFTVPPKNGAESCPSIPIMNPSNSHDQLKIPHVLGNMRSLEQKMRSLATNNFNFYTLDHLRWTNIYFHNNSVRWYISYISVVEGDETSVICNKAP